MIYAPGFPQRIRSLGGILILGLTVGVANVFSATVPAPEEMAEAHRWITAKVETRAAAAQLEAGLIVLANHDPVLRTSSATADPPFSFNYGGTPSALLLKDWTVKRETRPLDADRTEHATAYSDPKTRLLVRWTAIEYHDFPTLEWTLVFRNEGTTDTPLLSDVRAIDTRFHRGTEGEFTLHSNTGSPCSPHDYEPHVRRLEPRAAQQIATSGGRSTDSNMPYFNVEWPGQGVIVVLGWPGQWAAEFIRDDTTGLQIRGGQELTHFKLHPGEDVRAPLAVLQFWKGDWIRSQNTWRRWMLAHNLPRPGGKPMPAAIMACMSDTYPGMKSNAADEIRHIDRFVKADAKPDYWWIDAGWYPCGEGWGNVGTWEPDPQRYPKGLREVADRAHADGMKLVVWFEPERVSQGSWLAENHPPWVLGGKKGGLLNLGNREARAWLTEHIDKMVNQQGIDLYRHDFNMEPLGFWRGNDPPDRQGITEIRHVEGLLAYWDELRRRHPNMPLDTCASGGRRNDLETLRRAVPLLRSDYRFAPTGTQAHTYGMAMWIPYYGTGVWAINDYVVRSHWCPWLGIGPNEVAGKGPDWTNCRRMVAELRRVAPYFSGDYYPLTAYSLDDTAWMAWQFDRPDLGEGVVQAFRRADSYFESARFPLGGLERDARYVITDLDSGKRQEGTGRELASQGLRISAETRSSATVLLYKKIGN